MAMTLVIIVVILLALFGLAFSTKRRFGVLGLALAAGVVLSQNASKHVADVLESFVMPVEPFTYGAAATMLLTLTPALILLAGGPTYRDKKSALIGATGFALLGTFFVLGPLTTALPTTGSTIHDILVILAQWQNVIVVVALMLALVDTFMVHGAVGRRYHKDKNH